MSFDILEMKEKVNRIFNAGDLSWEEKYDLIFSENISKKFSKAHCFKRRIK